MRVKCAALLFLILACLASDVRAESEITRRVFDNGLTAIVKEDHTKPVVAIRVYVRAGSIYEGEYLGSGASHFLEHMLFESTDTKTKEEIETARERMGGVSNAYTWKDHTCYHTQVRSVHFKEAFDLMYEGMFRALLPEPEFLGQREIILNEMRMGLDEPTRVLQKAFFETMYARHPARYHTIGYENLFKEITREDLVRYYHDMYIPERTVVVVVGDVNTSDVMAAVAETFGAEEPGRPPDVSLPAEPPQLGPREVIKEMDVEAAYIRLGFRTTTVGTDDAYALDVLSTYLGEGLSAHLRRRVQDELGLVTGISAYNATPGTYPGYFVVYAECKPSNTEAARLAILDELYSLRKKDIPKDGLEKAKKMLESSLVLEKQTVDDQASIIGSFELETGNPEFGDYYIERIRKVTREDARAVANKYFTEDNLTSVILAPRGTIVRTAETGLAEADRPMVMTELDNGIRLLVKENPAVEAVSVRIIVNGGGRVVPAGKEGLATVTAGMLLKGTRKRNAQEVAEAVERLGGSIFANATRDYLIMGVEMLAGDFGMGLSVLLDCLRNPAFPQEEFEVLRDRYKSFALSEDDDWETEAAKVLRANLYGAHPYGTLVSGKPETLEKLTREDLLDYYSSVVTPENIIVAVVGDIDADYVTARLEKEFSRWKPSGRPLPEPALDARPDGPKEIEYATDKEQSVVYLGFYGPTYNKDVHVLDVLDSILSGIYLPGGRLHTRLRGAGLVYVTHAYVARGRDPGFFGIYAACSPENRDKVFAIINEEIEKIKNETVPEEELERAKEVCLSVDAIFYRQSNADVATTAATDELLGLGYENRWRYAELVSAVTGDDVRAAANEYFQNPVIVVTKRKAEE